MIDTIDAHQKTYVSFPRISSVTIATSWLRSTLEFVKSLFHMFSYDQILKVSRSKIRLDI